MNHNAIEIRREIMRGLEQSIYHQRLGAAWEEHNVDLLLGHDAESIDKAIAERMGVTDYYQKLKDIHPHYSLCLDGSLALELAKCKGISILTNYVIGANGVKTKATYDVYDATVDDGPHEMDCHYAHEDPALAVYGLFLIA